MNNSKGTRRRIRFSLRTLLLVSVTVTAAIAWSTTAYRTGLRHERVGQELSQLGCYPSFTHEEIVDQMGFVTASQVITETRSTLPQLVQRLGLDPIFRRIRTISIAPGASEPETISQLLQQLGSIESLGIYVHVMSGEELATALNGKAMERLYLRYCQLEDDLPWLNINGLVWLTIENTEFSDAAVKNLPTSLTHLALLDSPITDSGGAQLSRLVNLQTLVLEKTQITADGATRLQDSMPWCEVKYE